MYHVFYRVFNALKLRVKSPERVRVMLVLKKKEVLKPVETPKTAPKKEASVKTEKKSKLPPDTYKKEFPPIVLELDENRDLHLCVQRGGDLGLPHVDIRVYQHNQVYTGYTQKGINFPIEFLEEFIDKVNAVYEISVERELV